MAQGESYPVEILDGNGIDRLTGVAVFTDAADQPVPITNPITSGALPALSAWVSGTAKQNTTGRPVTVCVEVVTDGTANAATCAIALSADGSTFTTVATPGADSAVNTVGSVTMLATVPLPTGWYVKITLSHAAAAASVYY